MRSQKQVASLLFAWWLRPRIEKSVGPIPAVLGQRSEGAQAEEQETADDGQESRRNRMETAGG